VLFMKVAIFYQSVTGNTKYIAEIIKQGLEETGIDCELFNMHNLNFEDFPSYDFFGFGAPVFAFREPELIRKFILNLPYLKGKFAFLFCTCAGTSGNYFFRVAHNLLKKGVTVFAKGEFYFPSSYTVWRKKEDSLSAETDHLQKSEIDKALTFGQSLLSEYDAVSQGTKPILKIKRNIPGTFLGTVSSDWALRFMLGTIHVNEALCTRCEACANICPTNAIRVNPFPIITKKSCTGCCGCINICPVRALDSKKTSGKMRYKFNPALIDDNL